MEVLEKTRYPGIKYRPKDEVYVVILDDGRERYFDQKSKSHMADFWEGKQSAR